LSIFESPMAPPSSTPVAQEPFGPSQPRRIRLVQWALRGLTRSLPPTRSIRHQGQRRVPRADRDPDARWYDAGAACRARSPGSVG
jgi:hypothetical protein